MDNNKPSNKANRSYKRISVVDLGLALLTFDTSKNVFNSVVQLSSNTGRAWNHGIHGNMEYGIPFIYSMALLVDCHDSMRRFHGIPGDWKEGGLEFQPATAVFGSTFDVHVDGCGHIGKLGNWAIG